MKNKGLYTPENSREPEGKGVSHRNINGSQREINGKDATSVLWERLWLCTQRAVKLGSDCLLLSNENLLKW